MGICKFTNLIQEKSSIKYFKSFSALVSTIIFIFTNIPLLFANCFIKKFHCILLVIASNIIVLATNRIPTDTITLKQRCDGLKIEFYGRIF